FVGCFHGRSALLSRLVVPCRYFWIFSTLSIRYFCFLKMRSTSRDRYLTMMASTAKTPAKPRVRTNIMVVQPSTGWPVEGWTTMMFVLTLGFAGVFAVLAII